MILGVLRDLYAYSAWANARVLDTAEQLSSDQFGAEAGPSHGSLRNTLVHQLSGQWIWLERWRGHSPERMMSRKGFADLASVRARWDQIESDTCSFVADLTEEQLGRVISYTTTEGQERDYPLWQLLVHQANHATQHRSEAAVMLTNFGHSPGDLDYVVYLMEIGKGTRE